MGIRHSLIDTAPLRSSPEFRRLWIGRACSGLGSQMTFVAVMFQVWQMTHSTVWTGAVGLAMAVPVIAFGLFAGAIIDRGDRRRLYLIATTGQAGCSLLLAVQGFTGHLPVTGVLGLVAAASCFMAVGGPASRTFIPHLLPTEQVAAGLALNRISFQGAVLFGPALGGLVLAWQGVSGCYLIDAVTFGITFYGAFGLPPVRPDGDISRPGRSGVLDGLGFLVRSPAVRGALLTDLAATVLSFPVSLFPLINAQRFGGNPRTLGLFLTAIAAGGVAASVFSGVFTRRSRPGLVMLGGSAAWGAGAGAVRPVPERVAGAGILGGGRRGRYRRGGVAQHDRAVEYAKRSARPGGGSRADRRPGGPRCGQHAGGPGCGRYVGHDGPGERWPHVPGGGCGGRGDLTRASPLPRAGGGPALPHQRLTLPLGGAALPPAARWAGRNVQVVTVAP